MKKNDSPNKEDNHGPVSKPRAARLVIIICALGVILCGIYGYLFVYCDGYFADVDATDEFGNTPLHEAAEDGQVRRVKNLIAAGADVNAKGSFDQTPLLVAVEQDNGDIVRILLDAGADVNAMSSHGNTPLHYAADLGAFYDHADMVKILLDAAADVNAADVNGMTPLHEAALNDRADVVTALLAAGADVRVTDSDGSAPLHLAAAGREGGVGLIGAMLGATPVEDDGKGRSEIVQALLDAGADVQATDNDGNTPLHLAAKSDRVEVISIQLNAGADMHAKDGFDRTPIDSTDREAVRSLLKGREGK